MKTILIYVTILFSVLSHSQNKEVDKRNGFKDIKLGAHYLSFKGIKEIPTNDPNKIIGLWNTTDKELGYFFDDKIDYFELTFDKKTKELIAMQVVLVIKKPYTEPSVLNKFKEISDKLIIVLGKVKKSKEDTIEFLWFGSKTGMSFRLKPQKIKLDNNGNKIGLTSLIFSVLLFDKAEKYIKKGL